MFPVLCLGQTELDSIAMEKRSDSVLQNARLRLKYILSGFYKQDENDHYGAISDFTKILELSPDSIYDNAGVYFSRGFSKMKLGDNNGAISDYDKAIELDPNDEEYYEKRALAKGGIEDYLGAVIDATRSIELNPENAISYKIRGLNFLLLKYECRTLQCRDLLKACDLGDDEACEYYSEKNCH